MGARALGRRDVHDFDIEVVRRGAGIGDAAASYAERKVRAAARTAARPVRFGRITLGHEPNRSIERPAVVAVTLEMDGEPIHAHASGKTVSEAVDLLEERLRRQLLEAHQRIAFMRRRVPGVES